MPTNNAAPTQEEWPTIFGEKPKPAHTIDEMMQPSEYLEPQVNQTAEDLAYDLHKAGLIMGHPQPEEQKSKVAKIVAKALHQAEIRGASKALEAAAIHVENNNSITSIHEAAKAIRSLSPTAVVGE